MSLFRTCASARGSGDGRQKAAAVQPARWLPRDHTIFPISKQRRVEGRQKVETEAESIGVKTCLHAEGKSRALP